MTDRESSIASLRETHSFPCDYEFKVIGANDEQFVARVVELGTEVVGRDEQSVTTRESGEGTYISITVAFEIHEAETILDVYENVRELDDVQVVL